MSNSNRLSKIILFFVFLFVLVGLILTVILLNRKDSDLDDRGQASTGMICRADSCGRCGFGDENNPQEICPQGTNNQGVVCVEYNGACVDSASITPTATPQPTSGAACLLDRDCQPICVGDECNQCVESYSCDQNRCKESWKADQTKCVTEGVDGMCFSGVCKIDTVTPTITITPTPSPTVIKTPTPTSTAGLACNTNSDCQPNCTGSSCNQCVLEYYCDPLLNQCKEKPKGDGAQCTINGEDGSCSAGMCSTSVVTPTNPTPTPTITPITPTSTVTTTVVPSPTNSDVCSCALKKYGDFNCNGDITLADFSIFLEEFRTYMNSNGTDPNQTYNSDVYPASTPDRKITLGDFNVWREAFVTKMNGGGLPSPTGSNCVTQQTLRQHLLQPLYHLDVTILHQPDVNLIFVLNLL